jgi:hypothetical protein
MGRPRNTTKETAILISPGHPDFKPGPVYEAAVRRLITGALAGTKGTLFSINELLEAVGCVTNLSRATYQYGMLNAAFHDNLTGTDRIVREGLAAASDASGAVRLPCNDMMAVLLYALSRLDNWRTLIEHGHDQHAFARNLLVYFGDKDYSFNAKWALSMASEWLRVDKEPFVFVEYPGEDGLKQRQQEVAAAMFGEHWWEFSGPHGDEIFDPEIVMTTRPQFLPGLVPCVETTNLSLPALDPGC